ncbi:hypothetical protein ACFU99_16045 [Streptomyces sp. NPDC057654]|uniref:hypothetical protein n=1 Tax=Streptomyces sp. NPDC057654 TaxID=3346196 RepID=UPI00368BF3A8
MSTLADRIELSELMGRYADIADLKDFTRLPPSSTATQRPSTSPRSPACRP